VARREIVDYSQAWAGPVKRRSRRPWSRRRLTLIGALVVLLVGAGAFGATQGRTLWRNWQSRPTAASHPLDQGQLNALQQVGNPADNSNGQRALGAAGGPSPSPTAAAVLSVPYSVQAPNANWKVFENACEEDALLMYHDYLEGDHRTDIPASEADSALRSMQKWQVDNWGAEKDLTIERTGQLAKALWGYSYEVLPATRENIRAQVAAGRPVIIPVMTHSLENHYYGPNTVYHEVLVKGYKDDGVITNDGGVAQGKNWFYAWNIMYQAIDAQTPKLSQGRVMLVLRK
jgi:hypothetical protein